MYIEDGRQIASPGSYPVAGFNFAPMYNLNYKFRVGASLDGVYDGSANVYTYMEGLYCRFEWKRHASSTSISETGHQHQLSLGVSGRAEYVMPYFTIGVGIGANVLGRGDLRGLYQILALKIGITRSTFLHIGYNLQNFQTPNYLISLKRALPVPYSITTDRTPLRGSAGRRHYVRHGFALLSATVGREH